MLKLTISKDALASFREALCSDRPLDPGEGGWTFDKMMMLARLCQLLPLAMDSKRLRKGTQPTGTEANGRNG